MKYSLLIVLQFVGLSLFAQIPNGGFESWTNMGTYNNPDSWWTMNNITAPLSVFTCTKGTPGSPGSSYLKLTTLSATGLGIVPGIAISSDAGGSGTPTTGFPFSQRPANLTGNFQHMIFGTDQGYINVLLTRWDATSQSQVVVGFAYYDLSGMAMSWTAFTIPLTYSDGGNPDTCLISMSASGSSGGAANDYLYVDNLAFTGTASGISEVNGLSSLMLYPNPVKDEVRIDLSSIQNGEFSLTIYDNLSRMVRATKQLERGMVNQIDVRSLPAGNYYFRVESSEGARVFRVIVD
ncbi:MAG: T9SS type A sorting domain-containing protein [Bacteroidia bacterium]